MGAPGGDLSGPANSGGKTLELPSSKTNLSKPLLRRFKLHVNSFLNVNVGSGPLFCDLKIAEDPREGSIVKARP
jgi:hypothetical protein